MAILHITRNNDQRQQSADQRQHIAITRNVMNMSQTFAMLLKVAGFPIGCWLGVLIANWWSNVMNQELYMFVKWWIAIVKADVSVYSTKWVWLNTASWKECSVFCGKKNFISLTKEISTKPPSTTHRSAIIRAFFDFLHAFGTHEETRCPFASMVVHFRLEICGIHSTSQRPCLLRASCWVRRSTKT